MRIPILTGMLERERERGRADAERTLLSQNPAANPIAQTMSGIATPPIPQYEAYHWDYPYQYTVPQSPRRRPGSVIDLTTLRYVADVYDVLRACIEHLKREVCSVPLEIVAKPGRNPSDLRLRKANEWFGTDGGLGGCGKIRTHFEKELLEDLLVIGCSAIYTPATVGGAVHEALALDSATIRPKVDGYGWSDCETAFEQWVQGLWVASFTAEELRYDGLYPRSYTPFYASPVEWLIRPVMAALKADDWNMAWLTTGNTPSDILAMPDDWTPEQIRQFYEFWDSMHSGSNSERQKTKFVPGGTQRVGNNNRKDQDFQEYELWLLRRTCSIFGVHPSSIGYAGEQYKVSQEGSNDQTSAFGAGVVLEWRKAQYDYLLGRLGYDDLETVNVNAREEDANVRTDRLVKSTGGKGYKTVNEVRGEEGLDPIEGGDALSADRPAAIQEPEPDADDLKRWERKALNRLKDGKAAACPFDSTTITRERASQVSDGLARANTPADVRRVFSSR